MDEHAYKSHNKTLLLYHFVFPAKYRKKIFDNTIDNKFRDVCLEISERYEINFVEIGNDVDHMHILVQSVPTITVARLVTIIKSITAKEIFKVFPQLKKRCGAQVYGQVDIMLIQLEDMQVKMQL
jgi:REP element-mobilizing transposase RayT